MPAVRSHSAKRCSANPKPRELSPKIKELTERLFKPASKGSCQSIKSTDDFIKILSSTPFSNHIVDEAPYEGPRK
jgi:hypothetical protein